MFNRLVIVFMLMLFPFQWSVAQGHELRDDAGAFETVFSAGADITQRLAHTDEPGGICQFHELSQSAAALPAHEAGDLLDRTVEAWSVSRHVDPLASHAPSEIEKPKWGSRHPSAANS